MRSAAIIQSNYIPWKGYFHIIRSVDDFVFLDDVQYTPRDWRNRNRIKTSDGPKWLSVPVHATRGMAIREAKTAGHAWQQKHLTSLRHAYGRCPCFAQYEDFLVDVYERRQWEYLWELNHYVTGRVCELLGIATTLHTDAEFDAPQGKNERLLHILQQLGARRYVTGPAAAAYLDEELFRRHGIEVEYFSYPAYPEYPQLHGAFLHQVSVLDLLFHMGGASPQYIWRSDR